MASGTLIGSYSSSSYLNQYGFTVLASIYQTQNIEKNTSTIEVEVQLKFTDSVSYTVSKSVFSSINYGGRVTIDGTNYDYSYRSLNGTASNGTTILLGSVKTTVSHKTDGTKKITLKVNDEHEIWTSYMDSSMGGASAGALVNASISLKQIERIARITSAPNFTDESNPVVTYSNPSGSQATAVHIGIANYDTGMLIVPYKEVSVTGTSYTFNFTDEERDALRELTKTSTSAMVTFYIQTTLNGVLYWRFVDRTFTIANANPVITASVKDTNTSTILLTGSANKLVRYCSTAQATMSAVGQKGAVIDLDTMVIRNGGSSAFSSPAIFNNVESNIFTFGIGDSRGATSSIDVTVPMVEYVRLTCNIERADLDANGGLLVDISGNYFNGSFGNYNNTLTAQFRYKLQEGAYGNWFTMDTSVYEDNTYTASITVPGLNYREKYVIQCRVIDRLSDTTTPETVVKSFPVFHWSENDFVFEVPVIFNAGVSGAEITPGEGSGSSSNSGIIEGNATIGGDCSINGNLRLKGAGNYGNTLYFGDGSYTTISEPSDDTLAIKATTLNLNATTVNLNGNPIGYGTWIPKLNNSSAVSSYSVQQGWYSRMGNVITIGWQLKATINSGYSSTSLSISGVPFTPAYAAFGGGVAHNINVSAGFNFEGWTIDTSGSISARMQPCNGTSAGNLQISSTAYYPTGSGNVLTLAGTICYVIN